jgi:hypothetical protein
VADEVHDLNGVYRKRSATAVGEGHSTEEAG